MSNSLHRLSPLWQTPVAPPRWVIWHAGQGDVMVFDREDNIPHDVDDADLAEVLRRMRGAGVPEFDDYPGRRCA
ncbi:hypothetical protein [Streptomyces sp. NPDC008121]|uniref:hypothetical protein n=1 Tax=Streptomyces sp. NPDC008121 TaxID=3364809 RepID=UPI0036E5E242